MDAIRKPARLPFLVMAAALLLAIAQPALAKGDLAAGTGGGRVAASATIQFKIVVHEVVRFEAKHFAGNAAPRDLRSPPQQRSVEQLGGLQMVTLARP